VASGESAKGLTSDFRDDAVFRTEVDGTLRKLLDQIDALETDAMDPRLTEGSLAVTFEDGGVLMLSQQTPTHELWLSASLTAWHFKHAGGRWVERDSAVPMEDVLSGLFAEKLGLGVRFRL
jgi:CyaY protein